MAKPADTGPHLTPREFALGAGGALGGLAVGGVDVPVVFQGDLLYSLVQFRRG